MQKVFTYLKSAVSTAEFMWKLLTWAIVLGGGTTAAVLAAGSKLVDTVGHAWIFAFGLLCALIISLIFYFARQAQLASAQASLATAMAMKPSDVNPLSIHFADTIIQMSSLHLPGQQLHRNKNFRRCKFVGPGAVALLGGTFEHNNFNGAGDILTIPDNTEITGITVFQNCTVEHCEFYQVTLLVPRHAAEAFAREPGASVAL